MPSPMRSPESGFAANARKPANVVRIMGSRMPKRYVVEWRLISSWYAMTGYGSGQHLADLARPVGEHDGEGRAVRCARGD